MSPRSIALSVLAVAASLGYAGTANSAQPYYAGKTIDITVSSDTGGGYDTYSRLLARHLPEHIPGKPIVVVQNMPGGGGLRSAQYIFDVAPKNGTVLGNIRASNILDAVLGIRGKIEPSKFEWIGNMAGDTDVCSFSNTSGIRTFEDLKKKEVIVGASGKGAQNFSFPNAINHILGTKMKIVLGYKGAADRILAVERGELQGNCGINGSTITSNWPQLIADGKLILVTQSGLKPYSALPKVPMTQSFAKTDEQRKILDTIFSQMAIARMYAMAPGTSKDHVATLREAFMAAMNDPYLKIDAQKAKVDLDPDNGEQVAKIITGLTDLSPALKKKAREAIGG